MPKNHELHTRFEKDEMEKLQKKAKSLGLKVSQYVRMITLGSLNTEIKVK